MSLRFSLTSLFIVVYVHAQLQKPSHALGDETDPDQSTPRPSHYVLAGRSSLDGHVHSYGGQNQLRGLEAALHSPAYGQTQLRGPTAQLDQSVRAKANALSSFPSVSGQIRNEPSTVTKSPRLKSLYSSVQHVLRAKSLKEKMGQSISHRTSRFEPGTFSRPRIYTSGQSSTSPEDSAYYFVDDVVKTVEGASKKDNDAGLNPAVAAEIPKTLDSSNTHNIPEDHESVTLSSLLHESFLERNPPMGPGFQAGRNAPQSSMIDSAPEPDHRTPNLPQQLSSLVSKRDKEMVSEDAFPRGSQQYGHNDTALSVQERSWRCTAPDVHVGDGDLPWTCHQRWAWRFLGEHVYPSRLYEVVCEGPTCWYGHFNCTPITYTLHVLEVCSHGCHDQRVPFPLRSLWQWTDLNVTVGCQCVR